MTFDYLIVGCGLSGSTCARLLAEQNYKVCIIDQRHHVAGNCYDRFNEYGVFIHEYGPHIFHTNNKSVWNFLERFTSFVPYFHVAKTLCKHGVYVDFPPNLNTIKQLCVDPKEYEDKELDCTNAETYLNSTVGQTITDLVFRGYSEKQWGVSLSELKPSVVERVHINKDYYEYYFRDLYQGLPKFGYTQLVRNMLDHPNIKLILGVNYFEIGGRKQKILKTKKTIFTGPIDQFFDYEYGELEYLKTKFEFKTFTQPERFQNYAQINYADRDVPYTRTVEFKLMTKQRHQETTVCYEYPNSKESDILCYPKVSQRNGELYLKYQSKKISNVHFIGRLGSFDYMNMDKAVLRAMQFCGVKV